MTANGIYPPITPFFYVGDKVHIIVGDDQTGRRSLNAKIVRMKIPGYRDYITMHDSIGSPWYREEDYVYHGWSDDAE